MKPPIPRLKTTYEVQTFYHFQTLSKEEISRIDAELCAAAKQLGINGLIILGQEGLNATASGEPKALAQFVSAAGEMLSPGFRFQNIKSSWIEPGEKIPFLDFVVKVRTEIVTLKRSDLLPYEPGSKSHLSPEEWHNRLSAPDAVVIDTRNSYEWAIGTFKGALTPQIEEFSDFPDWVESQVKARAIDPKTPAYIFCTGGIRCEKAIRSLEEKGFSEVYQLDGGILNYINHFPKSAKPDSLWNGECFVFDNRIAVDGDGHASQAFSACPHCGQPAAHAVFCSRCDTPATLCESCFEKQSEAESVTCSKNCAHHWALHPGKKGRPQVLARQD